MKTNKQHIGTISGQELLLKASGKLNRNDGVVKSGCGIHKDKKQYNRKGKKNQQLKNQLKNYGSKVVDFFCLYKAAYILEPNRL
jgi:hypothetical protein